MPASILQSHYIAWYAFLRVLIEGCESRRIELRGVFEADVAAMNDILRRFRNAVFHTPAEYHDKRLQDLFSAAETSADKIRRVHGGFSRLFYEEFQARKVPKA